ncbi:hypothetical protein NPIL_33881 [Nephila pilipes]|uniref:Uncharacterized protein n=1 Tax=Nephila pilipes TaxID=299642 RepID=A0A8X6NE03_NEPPI|nr:hypothetical protein NPIL_33881 [Nephila pilipes]
MILVSQRNDTLHYRAKDSILAVHYSREKHLRRARVCPVSIEDRRDGWGLPLAILLKLQYGNEYMATIAENTHVSSGLVTFQSRCEADS